MFPSRKKLDKTINDINNKASSLIKFQSSPKKNITSPKKEKYKAIKESAKPMYSKARLTMDGNGFRDHQSKIPQKNRQRNLHTRQRQSSVGESDNSSKNSRNNSFENEIDEGNNIDKQVKNNEPIPIALKCKYNKSSMIKQESIELSLKTDHTPKLNEDYFLVRTYQRGGSCLQRVPFTEEEKEILKRQKEEKENLKQQQEEKEILNIQKEEEKEILKRKKEEKESLKQQDENEILNRQKEEEEITRKQKDEEAHFNDSTDSFHQEINKFKKFHKIIRTDSILSETDSMKDFTAFCHSRVENDNINQNDTNDITTTNQENSRSVSIEDENDLLHIMDDSGQIVWNTSADKYDVGPFVWYDNAVLCNTNNQNNNKENNLNNVSVVKPVEINQQCNIDITENNENLDIPEVILSKNISEDDNNDCLDIIPNGFRNEVQSPDPRNYEDSFVSEKHPDLNSELSNNNLV